MERGPIRNQKFDSVARRQCLVKIDLGQQKNKNRPHQLTRVVLAEGEN